MKHNIPNCHMNCSDLPRLIIELGAATTEEKMWRGKWDNRVLPNRTVRNYSKQTNPYIHMYYHHLYLTIYLPVIDSEQRLCSITHLHSNSFKCFTTENGDHHVTQETTVFGQIAKMCSWQWRNFVLKGPPALTVIWPGLAYLKWGGGVVKKTQNFLKYINFSALSSLLSYP
jgi:hypothetical protein